MSEPPYPRIQGELDTCGRCDHPYYSHPSGRIVKTDAEKYAQAVWRQNEPRRRAMRDQTLATESPNPKRITMALDYQELYGPEVDHAFGLEEPAVDEWEAGTRIPTPAQMIVLAEMTGFPVEFFYREDPMDVTGPMFVCSRGV